MIDVRLVDILLVSKSVQMKVLEWRNRREIRVWMNNPKEISLKEHKNWLRSLEKVNKRVFVIYVGRKPVGVIQLLDINDFHKTADVGLYIIDQEKGYGKAAVEKIMEDAFGIMKLSKLTANVISGNKRSILFFQRCGFHMEGCQVDQVFAPYYEYSIGKRLNLLWFGITKNEWEFHRRAK